MESVQYLLRFLFKLAIVVFFVALVWWGVATFAPSFSFRSLFLISSGTSTVADSGQGWLPAPKNFKSLFGTGKTPTGEDNVYVPGPAFDGYKNLYKGNQGGQQANLVSYTTTGVQITNGVGTPGFNSQQQPTANGYSQKNLYIRNLSIYENGHIYTGLDFVGEARNSMFLNGKFPIIIADKTGHAVFITYAEATTNWTAPGWVKFKTKITGSLPNKVPCTMVFEQARAQNFQGQPIRVAISETCN